MFLFRVGFTNTTTVEKICQAFPELDMVNHNHRTRLVGFRLLLMIILLIGIFSLN